MAQAQPSSYLTSATPRAKATADSQIKSGHTKSRNKETDEDGWAGFGGYMTAKRQKLDEQLNQSKDRESQIFAGVAVYINGYTNPSSDELRAILRRHGGTYEMYLSKMRVTHIVATNLPNSKFRLARTIPVVRPEWIVDSVAAGKRLSHVPYLLINNQSKLQPGLRGFSSLSADSQKMHQPDGADPSLQGCQKVEIKNVGAGIINCRVKIDSSEFDKYLNDGGKVTLGNISSFGREDMQSAVKPVLKTETSHVSFENSGYPLVEPSCVKSLHCPSLEDSKEEINSAEINDGIDDDVVYNSEEDIPVIHNSSKLQSVKVSRSCIKQNTRGAKLYSLRLRGANSPVVNTPDVNGAIFFNASCQGNNSQAGCGMSSQFGESSLIVGHHQELAEVTSTNLENSSLFNGPADRLSEEFLVANSATNSSALIDSDLNRAGSSKQTTECTGCNSTLQIPEVDCSKHKLHHSGSPSTGSSVSKLSLAKNKTLLNKNTNIENEISCLSIKITKTSPMSSSLEPLANHPNTKQDAPIPCFKSSNSASVEQFPEVSTTTTGLSYSALSIPEAQASSETSSLLQPHLEQTCQRTSVLVPYLEQTSHKTSTMARAGDKEFLNEFYSNSRLHHIATWGAELKAYVAETKRSGDCSYPGRARLRLALAETALGLNQLETLHSSRCHRPEKTVMHIDMDCFFVSVGLLSRADLKGKPVAVTHSRGRGRKPNTETNFAWERAEWVKKRTGALKVDTDGHLMELEDLEGTLDDEVDDSGTNRSTQKKYQELQTFHSMAEIASCSYEARKAGVRNGMFMGKAVQLCPNLQTIPYNFAEYNRISRILYDLVISYTHDIEAVSCDEMLVDCTDLLSDTGATVEEFARILRAEILEKTGCTASAGIGPNILLARLATRKAKPNGQFVVTAAEAKDFIKEQPVSDLPGVGYSITRKLSQLGVQTCGDLQRVLLATLRQEFGPKLGETLHAFSVGLDSREIKGDKQRKSVSAEVNYGIRFTQESQVATFLHDLSSEVKRRLDAIGVKGRCITLKLMVRRPDAPVETAKFMGHGICNTINKSSNLPVSTSDENVIAREVVSLYRSQRLSATDIRGIGIHVQKLELTEVARGKPRGRKSADHQSILSFAVARTCNAITDSLPVAADAPTVKSTVTEVKSTVTEVSPSRNLLALSLSDNSDIATEAAKPTLACDSEKQWTAVPAPLHRTELTKKWTAVPAPLHRTALTKDSGSVKKENPAEHSKSLTRTEDFTLPNTKINRIDASCTTHFNSELKQYPDLPEPSREVNKVADPSFLSESQIDSDILLELPAHIAQEILEDLRSRKRLNQHDENSVSNSSAVAGGRKEVVSTRGREEVISTGSREEVVSTSEQLVRSGGEAVLPSLSQLDLDCFNALPSSLQRELKCAYAKQKAGASRPFSTGSRVFLPEENIFTRLKSPTKSSRGKSSTAAQGSRQQGRRGRPPGKKLLQFGNKRIKAGEKVLSPQKCGRASHSEMVVLSGSSDESTRDSVHSLVAEGGTSAGQDNLTALADRRVTTEVTFCGCSKLEDVRSLLKEWLASCSEPQAEDVSMVTEYLGQLVRHRNLEHVFYLLKLLTRHLVCTKQPHWKTCLLSVVSNVQNLVTAHYGSTLKL